MRWITVLGLVLLAPVAARAGCQEEIAATSARAQALGDSPGKAALLEQIQRAEVARHEGDDADCAEQFLVTTDVLDRIDAARLAETDPRRTR